MCFDLKETLKVAQSSPLDLQFFVKKRMLSFKGVICKSQ
jgi:hypothetical protein